MIDFQAKNALRNVINILDDKAEQVSDMIVEAIFDNQDTFTVNTAISYLEEVLDELRSEIGQVLESLKGVMPSSEEPQPIAELS
jgi:tRNA U54 and U55 pseudouridine synthase Pus10